MRILSARLAAAAVLAASLCSAGLPARAAGGVFCDEIAPVTQECTASYVTASGHATPGAASQGYIGTVTATISAFDPGLQQVTGTATHSCTIAARDYLTNQSPVAHCHSSFTGFIIQGEEITLHGTISGAVPGGPGVGPWAAYAND